MFMSKQNEVSIQITFPKVTLVNGIWWSTYYKDWRTGYLLKFGKVTYSHPASLGSTSYSFSTSPPGNVTLSYYIRLSGQDRLCYLTYCVWLVKARIDYLFFINWVFFQNEKLILETELFKSSSFLHQVTIKKFLNIFVKLKIKVYPT